MSNVVSKSSPFTSSETTTLQNLAALGTSSSTQAIQKTGANTFANVNIGGGALGGFSFATLTGAIDGSNLAYTFTATIAGVTMIVLRSGTGMREGILWFLEGIHYTKSGSTVTFINPVDSSYAGFIPTLVYIS
ncbi:MAG: hypothetical protein V4481_05305 [Patescibacteria group bacterium]